MMESLNGLCVKSRENNDACNIVGTVYVCGHTRRKRAGCWNMKTSSQWDSPTLPESCYFDPACKAHTQTHILLLCSESAKSQQHLETLWLFKNSISCTYTTETSLGSLGKTSAMCLIPSSFRLLSLRLWQGGKKSLVSNPKHILGTGAQQPYLARNATKIMLQQMYLISVMSGQFCRAEAKLAAPVAVRLAPQNLEETKAKISKEHLKYTSL